MRSGKGRGEIVQAGLWCLVASPDLGGKAWGALEFSCSLALVLLGARGMPELLADIPISRSLV